MMYHYADGMWGWGVGGFLFMIVFWIIIAWLIVALIRGLRGDYHYHRHRRRMDRADGETGDSALVILKERYAKGEINKEEFEQKKKDLSG